MLYVAGSVIHQYQMDTLDDVPLDPSSSDEMPSYLHPSVLIFLTGLFIPHILLGASIIFQAPFIARPEATDVASNQRVLAVLWTVMPVLSVLLTLFLASITVPFVQFWRETPNDFGLVQGLEPGVNAWRLAILFICFSAFVFFPFTSYWAFILFVPPAAVMFVVYHEWNWLRVLFGVEIGDEGQGA